MLQLKLKVVIVRVRSETDFLHNHFLLLRLNFFLLLFLIVQELLVLNDATNGGVGLWRNLHQVQFQFTRKLNGVTRAHDSGLDIVAHHTHLRRFNLVIDAVKILSSNTAPVRGPFSSNRYNASVLVILLSFQHFRNLRADVLRERFNTHASQVPFSLPAHGYGSFVGLVFSQDEHVGNLL